ncbi:WSC domain-containing protein [Podospora fimiseda]|uniref:WSC domain-containing protein n=1 Tax=Podospora fimiseda TaxID=252190 RepID=A0AAN7BID7_9PEZI|nr:WSC domain-containing protein [Podospora fimiseda]
MASTHSSLRQLLPLVSLFTTTVLAFPSQVPSHHEKRALPEYSPLGCYFDNEGGKRAISASSYASDDMTVESCVEFCGDRSHAFAGVEYGRECYCGDIITPENGPASAADCSFPCAGNPLQKCGAGNRLNLYIIETAPVKGPANLPGITSLGCYVDTPARVFPYRVIGTDDMTAAKCAENCAGYPYFGTQYSRECFCGATAPSEPTSASDCSMTCTGNENEYCGGGMRLNVYRVDSLAPTTTATDSTTPPTETPTASPVVDGYEYRGCWTDNVPNRALPGKTFADGAMTLTRCANFCKVSSYGWFGVTYSSECFCGATLDPNSEQVAESDCNMPCSGDASEKCGAGNRLNVYADPALAVPVASNLPTVGEFSYKGCWTDDLADRTLTAVDFRDDEMTVEKCAERCASYNYFGVEFARECYCGDELGGVSAPEPECSSLCVGNGAQWCGAPYRLNLYSKFPTTTTSSVTTTESSTTSEEPTSTTESATTTEEPSTTTTEESTTSTSEPSSTPTDEPTFSSPEPTTTTEEPSTTTSEESTTTTEEPTTTESSTTTESTTTTEDNDGGFTTTSTEEPTTTEEPSSTTSDEPTTTTSEESTTVTEEPTTTTEEPSSTVSEESTTTTEEPTTTTSDEPTTTSESTTATSEEPTTTTEEPITSTEEPSTTTSDEPTTTTEEQTTTPEPSTTSSDEPTTTSSEESTTSTEDPTTTTSEEPSTTTSEEPSTTTSEESTTTSSEEPTTTPETTTSSEEPTATTSEEPTSTSESTTSEEPTTTTSSEEPTSTSESTTSEEPTTMTTSEEPTSTSESTTSEEPTTTTTSEESTTASESTTSSEEPTTTTTSEEPTSTSESTTSEEPTTTTSSEEPTSTSESTTSEESTTKTTSEEPTSTSESTTSEEPTTTTTSDEPTTTPESTTSSEEPTTTTISDEPTTTSSEEPTTTSHSTTSSEEPTTSTASEEPTTTTSELSSTSTEESTTTSPEPTSTSETSTSTEDSTTTSAQPTSTSTEESTTSPEPTTSSEEPTTTTVDPSTTSETSTSTSTTIPTSTTLSTVVSTTSTTSSTTTTQGPTLTTITSCPPTPTVAPVPDMCYYPSLPFNCDRLTSAFARTSLSTYLRQCQSYLTSFGVPANTVASSCFPAAISNPPQSFQASSTASSVWSCLQTAGVRCSVASSCTTATYPIGSVPPPVPTTGVNLTPNSGFEPGTGYDGWTAAGFTGSITQAISTTQKRTGTSAWAVTYANTAGTSGTLIRTVKNLEPGRTYQFKLWWLHTTATAQVRIWLGADPLDTSSTLAESNINGLSANVWRERTFTFVPQSSFQVLEIRVEGVRSGGSGTNPGRDVVYIDDISVVRTN